MQPLFSIIVPFYNESLYIKDTLISILNQQYKNFEIIFINDGSTDDTEKIINNISNGNDQIKILRQPHLGKCVARNTGIKAAVGQWICLLNCGDTYFQNHLRVFSDLINKNADVGVFCNEVLNAGNKELTARQFFFGNTLKLTMNHALNYNRFCLSQFCINKKLAEENLFPSMNMIISEDILFIRQIFYKAVVLKKQTITGTCKLKPRFEKDTISINEKVNWIKLSAELFINNYKPSQALINRLNFFTKIHIFFLWISYRKFAKASRALLQCRFISLFII